MSLITGLNEPFDLLLKLIREGNRINMQSDSDDLVDHLFNFSVTAHSLRDWSIKYLNVTDPKEKEKLHKEWNKMACLVAAKNIANSSKHFGIKPKDSKVTGVLSGTREVVELFGLVDSVDIMSGIEDGNGITEPSIKNIPSFLITFTSFPDLDLWDFVEKTIDYWAQFFDQHDIPRDKRYGINLLFWKRYHWPRVIADMDPN